MKIVYIGPKAVKRDTLTASRMVFPRYEPMEVEKEFAHVLLRFKTVYIEEKYLAAHIKKTEAAEVEAKKAEKLVLSKQAEVIKVASRVVVVDGKDIDLRKYSSIKLGTFVEAHDLNVTVKGAGEKLGDYCDRVFDAFAFGNADKLKGE